MKSLARFPMLLITLALLMAGSVPAAVVPIDGNAGATPLTLTTESPTGVTMRYAMESFTLDPVQVDGLTMQAITVPGRDAAERCRRTEPAGLRPLHRAPRGATANLRDHQRAHRSSTTSRSPPRRRSQGDRRRAARLREEPGDLRAQRALPRESGSALGGRSRCAASTWSPWASRPSSTTRSRKDLTVYTDLEVRVDFIGGNGQLRRGPAAQPLLGADPAESPAELRVAAAGRLRPAARRSRPAIEYVIICPDNPPSSPGPTR